MQNKTLIIVGMHRSGTSLITNWLHSCGLEVGEELLGAGLGNSEGHFEDVEFYKMHVEILRDNNLNDSGFVDDVKCQLSPYHREKLKSVIKVKNRLFEQWAWKDPRTCLFLDFYREILPDANYLVILRDYQSVVISLLKRTFTEWEISHNEKKGYLSKLNWKKKRNREYSKFCNKQASFFLKVWIFYNEKVLEALKLIQNSKYIVLNYSMLKTKDKDVISHMHNNWGISLNYHRFSDIINEKLFSKPFDVELFIADKQLIAKAKKIDEDFKAYLMN